MKLFLIVIYLSFMIFNGCKPDSDTPCREAHISPINFSDNEYGKFPFIGQGDTLRYISPVGDSLWCIGDKVILYYKTFPYKNNPDCADDSIGYTILQYNYADSLNKLHFTAIVYKYDSLLTIMANNSFFSLPLPKIGVNDSLSYFDSLQFGNRMFYHISSYVNTAGDSLYYSPGYGMIGLKQGAQHFYMYSFNNR